MAKKIVADVVADLKKILESKKMVIGSGETLKLLRRGQIKRVFISSNCAPQAKADIEHLCKVGDVELIELSQNNEEIGVLCRKPFPISVVGVTA